MADTDRLAELERKFAENPRRYFAPLANEIRKAGNPAAAAALCREQLARYPGHMSGYVVLGQALYESRESAGARDAFARALELDPENLIALRHLGDLAREAGDAAQARGWYQRVLEADPRNDDIAAQLEQLAPVVRHAPPAAAADAAPFAPAPPPPPPLEPLDWSTLDLGLPADAAAAPTTEPIPAELTLAGPESEPASAESEPVATDGLLDIDVDEVTGGPGAAPEAEALTPDDPASPVAWAELLPELPDAADEPLDAPELPEAMAGAVSEPEQEIVELIEAAVDVPVEPFNAAPDPTPAPADAWYDPVVGLDLPPVDVETTTAEHAVVTPDLTPDVTPEAPPAAPLAEEGPEDLAAAGGGPAPAAPFVTETMAGLLLRQGHHEQALEVYERLAEQRPHDEELRERVGTLRQSLTPATSSPAVSATPEVPAADAGASAGAFFAALAGDAGRDHMTVPASAEAGAPPADEPVDEPPPSPAALFAGAPTPEDDAAAERLASGFDEGPPGDGPTLVAALAALPSTPAPTPFAQTPAAPATPAAPSDAAGVEVTHAEFSFERFFEGLEESAPSRGERPAADPWSRAPDARVEAPAPPPAQAEAARAAEEPVPPPAPVPPPDADGNADDDLAQFNAWLKGLMHP
jgi:tetratricopeptide (TPR) repeat protein